MIYHVIVKNSSKDMDAEVTAYLQAGFELQGGVCVTEGMYYQAVISKIKPGTEVDWQVASEKKTKTEEAT